MGRRGPPPKPKALKQLEGTYRKDRDAVVMPEVPQGTPPMPEDMPKPAVRRWNEIVPALLKAGTLAVVDGGALEAYCRSYARWSHLDASAAKNPVFVTPKGPKLNPASVEARKLHKEIVQPLEAALGLHYAARVRAPAPEQEREDEDEKFLFETPRVIQGGKDRP